MDAPKAERQRPRPHWNDFMDLSNDFISEKTNSPIYVSLNKHWLSTFIPAGRKNDSLTIFRKMKFPEMAVRTKNINLASNKSLPESLPPTEVSAPRHSLIYNKKFD